MKTIVIQTALPLEQEAVVRKLSNVKTYEHGQTKTPYKIGSYISNGNKLQIVVGRTGQTNVNAAIETERAIQHFNPTFIFFVGVAGGLKDVSIGDIVLGTDVFGYEKGKSENEFLSRPKFAFSSYELEMKAVDFSSSKEWIVKSSSIVNEKFQNKVSVYPGTIASGDKVLASINSELSNYLRINCSHALAVETEGLGFLEACRPYSLIKSLLIRGISDLVEGKSDSDQEGSQTYASNNAAEFLFGFIDFLRINQEDVTLTLQEKLFEIATKLYPEGIKDKAIWLRSGGDLSLIQLNMTGKAQWIEALRLIENGGGGGDISFDSITNEMKNDYPKNESWKFL